MSGAAHKVTGNPISWAVSLRYPSRTSILVVLLLLLVCAVYSPLVKQQFVEWDDARHVRAVWKPGLERAWDIVSDLKLKFTGTSYYSPLFFLSLMSDQVAVLGGNHPEAWPSKLMNVVYHLINVLLVLKLLLMTGVDRRAAFVGAALFAVHPLQVGTVAWISERKNLLSTLFYLAGLMVFFDYYRTGKKRLLILLPILFIAGLLSKPSLVTLPVALASWIILVPHDKSCDRIAYRYIGLLLILAAAWGAFVVFTEISYPGILPPWYYRPFLAAGTIWFYLWKLLWPLGLSPIYPRWEVQEHLTVFLGLFAGLMVLGWLLVRYRDRFQPASLWGLFLFLLNVLPVSGLVPFGYMGHSFVSDHFVYLPMVGAALFISHETHALFSRIGTRTVVSNLILGFLVACVAVWAVLAHRQTRVWQDGASLWSYTLKMNDKAVAAYNNFGRYQMTRGNLAEALELLRKASQLAPNFDAPYTNMGHVYRAMGDDEKALEMFNKAISINRNAVYPRLIKAGIMKQEGKLDEAIAYLEKCVAKFPRSAEFRNELGIDYHQAGRDDEALKEFDAALKLSPAFLAPYSHKATILLSRGDKDEAAALLERAMRLGYVRPEAFNVLGAAYAAQGKGVPALNAFLSAYRIKPDLPAVCDNVANAYMDLGDYRAADDFCAQAARSGTPCGKETWKRLESEAPKP
jgi:protein O-mannosyl-transferase